MLSYTMQVTRVCLSVLVIGSTRPSPYYATVVFLPYHFVSFVPLHETDCNSPHLG